VNRDEAIRLLRGGEKGVRKWNRWQAWGKEIPGLSQANLSRANLIGADLSQADLSQAKLIRANLGRAHLNKADLSRAYLRGADLSEADLSEADLSEAVLRGADLSFADLSGAVLRGADLSGADLHAARLVGADLVGAVLINTDLRGADLGDANLRAATCAHTQFDDVDLSEVKEIELIRHLAPCTVGVDTLVRSRGKITKAFLEGCGVSDSLIDPLLSLLANMGPPQYYSCFLSYSTEDMDFVSRLYQRMRSANVEVWFSPADAEWGEDLHELATGEIQRLDKFLLVLSPHSVARPWVKTEIRIARKAEIKDGRNKIIPIHIVDREAIPEWSCFDSVTATDLAEVIGGRLSGDFSKWNDPGEFEKAFADLLKRLRVAAAKSPGGPTPSG
jgi:hypothetical protein